MRRESPLYLNCAWHMVDVKKGLLRNEYTPYLQPTVMLSCSFVFQWNFQFKAQDIPEFSFSYLLQSPH